MGNSEMKLTIHKTVTVITPTIGNPFVRDAIESVVKQTYPCRHLLVCDGHPARIDLINLNLKPRESIITVVETPDPTGANGFYGHRIYSAYPHLLNSDYILFLDEDNWYEPDHVETLIKTLEEGNLDFSYSLRKIFDKQGNYLCEDNCESLGKWPIFLSNELGQKHYLIDTSSFCFKREWLIQHCYKWHHGWGADRRFLYFVKDEAKYDTNGKHTLCYRLDGNPNSVTKEFFEQGNKEQHKHYGKDLPWLKKTS